MVSPFLCHDGGNFPWFSPPVAGLCIGIIGFKHAHKHVDQHGSLCARERLQHAFLSGKHERAQSLAKVAAAAGRAQQARAAVLRIDAPLDEFPSFENVDNLTDACLVHSELMSDLA